MIEQAASARRCASCQRWQGWRQAAPTPGIVVLDEERPRGICQGGPWHESERTLRSACGRWQLWPELGTDGV